MVDHVKVYEEKKGIPVWAWLLPLLLLLTLLAWFLLHRSAAPAGTSSVTVAPASQVPSAARFPDLGTVHFATDKATLSVEGQATLDRAAEAMKGNPDVHLRLQGYTDSTGNDPHNLNLSQQRAISVADYLKGKGIEGSRLTGNGFGPSNPADSNATATGKADNRRVELFTQK